MSEVQSQSLAGILRGLEHCLSPLRAPDKETPEEVGRAVQNLKRCEEILNSNPSREGDCQSRVSAVLRAAERAVTVVLPTHRSTPTQALSVDDIARLVSQAQSAMLALAELSKIVNAEKS